MSWYFPVITFLVIFPSFAQPCCVSFRRFSAQHCVYHFLVYFTAFCCLSLCAFVFVTFKPVGLFNRTQACYCFSGFLVVLPSNQRCFVTKPCCYWFQSISSILHLSLSLAFLLVLFAPFLSLASSHIRSHQTCFIQLHLSPFWFSTSFSLYGFDTRIITVFSFQFFTFLPISPLRDFFSPPLTSSVHHQFTFTRTFAFHQDLFS